MQRIIQSYRNGGGVRGYNEGELVAAAQPSSSISTKTGLPAGGNAAAAISSYMKGPLDVSISYDPNAIQQGTAYQKAADERSKLRAGLVAAGANAQTQAQAMNDADAFAKSLTTGGKSISTGSDGTTASWKSDQEKYGAPGGFWGGSADNETNLILNPDVTDDDFWDTFESGEASGNFYSGGGSDGAGNWGTLGDVGAGVRNTAASLVDMSLVGNAYKALAGKPLIPKYVPPAIDYTTPAGYYYTPPTTTTTGSGRTASDKAKEQAQHAHAEQKLDKINKAYNDKTGVGGGWTVGNTGGRVHSKTIGDNPLLRMGPLGGPQNLNAGGISIAQSQKVDEEQMRQAPLRAPQIAPQPQGSVGMLGDMIKGRVMNKGVDMAGEGLEKAAMKMGLKAGVSAIPVVGPFLAMLL